MQIILLWPSCEVILYVYEVLLQLGEKKAIKPAE